MISVHQFSIKFPSPIPPPSPPTVPMPAVDQRVQREALPADKKVKFVLSGIYKSQARDDNQADISVGVLVT